VRGDSRLADPALPWDGAAGSFTRKTLRRACRLRPMEHLSSSYVFSPDVARALRTGLPVVALESAVITHGLPRPENLNLALALEQEVREEGAVPATICLMDGRVRVGLTPAELQRLASEDGARKISRRD